MFLKINFPWLHHKQKEQEGEWKTKSLPPKEGRTEEKFKDSVNQMLQVR